MKRKANILFLQIYGGGGIVGGTEIYLKNLLNELTKEDTESEFFVASFNSKNSIFLPFTKRVFDNRFTRFLESWNVNNVLYRYTFIGFLASVWGFVFLYVTAARIIKKNNIDLIYSNGGHLTMLLAYTLNIRFKLPYVIHLHGLFNFKRLFRPEKILLKTLLLKGITKGSFRHASRVIANSREVADDVNAAMQWGKKARIIHCFTDSAKFFPRPKAAARKKLNLPQDTFIFFSPNRLDEHKGMDFLIDTLKRYRGRDILFLLAGDGNLRHDVENLAREHPQVRYLGPLSQNQLPDYYNAADLVWSGASVYYLALTHIEALACGTAIIALNTPFPTDNDFKKMVQPTTIPKGVGFIVKKDTKYVLNFFRSVVKQKLSADKEKRIRFYNKEYGKENIDRIKNILYVERLSFKTS